MKIAPKRRAILSVYFAIVATVACAKGPVTGAQAENADTLEGGLFTDSPRRRIGTLFHSKFSGFVGDPAKVTHQLSEAGRTFGFERRELPPVHGGYWFRDWFIALANGDLIDTFPVEIGRRNPETWSAWTAQVPNRLTQIGEFKFAGGNLLVLTNSRGQKKVLVGSHEAPTTVGASYLNGGTWHPLQTEQQRVEFKSHVSTASNGFVALESVVPIDQAFDSSLFEKTYHLDVFMQVLTKNGTHDVVGIASPEAAKQLLQRVLDRAQGVQDGTKKFAEESIMMLESSRYSRYAGLYKSSIDSISSTLSSNDIEVVAVPGFLDFTYGGSYSNSIAGTSAAGVRFLITSSSGYPEIDEEYEAFMTGVWSNATPQKYFDDVVFVDAMDLSKPDQKAGLHCLTFEVP
jgi:hypothetical protein